MHARHPATHLSRPRVPAGLTALLATVLTVLPALPAEAQRTPYDQRRGPLWWMPEASTNDPERVRLQSVWLPRAECSSDPWAPSAGTDGTPEHPDGTPTATRGSRADTNGPGCSGTNPFEVWGDEPTNAAAAGEYGTGTSFERREPSAPGTPAAQRREALDPWYWTQWGLPESQRCPMAPARSVNGTGGGTDRGYGAQGSPHFTI